MMGLPASFLGAVFLGVALTIGAINALVFRVSEERSESCLGFLLVFIALSISGFFFYLAFTLA
ncbi:MAG: hypothetical protein U9R25_08090 [Chloroflexota bacterium]|nr:hypothetical protein [Chloroflexota bacterium]